MSLWNPQIVKDHHNEIVITAAMDIGRLVGYADGEDDVYYIIRYPYGPRHGDRYISCVMPLIFLKDSLPASDYSLLNSLELNGCPLEPEFLFKKI